MTPTRRVTRARQGGLLGVAGLMLMIGARGGVAIAAAAVAVLESPRAMPVEDAVTRTLESPRYRFCVDPKYPLVPDETQWCAHLPRSPDPRAARCPAFPTACRAGATADLLHKSQPLNIHLPHFGGLGRLVLWTLVGGAVGFLLFLVVRHGMRGTWRRRDARDDKEAIPIPEASMAADREREIVERDVDRLLARARAAAAAHDFAAAIADLHAALLRRMAGDGHVRIQAWATNGDYVQELRGRAPDLAAPVQDVVRVVEAAEFGQATPDESVYQGLLRHITPLLARSAGLVVTALVAWSVVLSSCVPSLRSDWSASPSGSAAVAEFLTAIGHDARERLMPLRELGKAKAKGHGKGGKGSKGSPGTISTEATSGHAEQIVILPGAEVEGPEWTAVRDWLDDEDHTLILATGPRPLPDWLKTVEVVDTGATGPLQETSGLAISGNVPGLQGAVPGGGWVRTSVPVEDVLLVRGAHAYALLAPNDIGRVIVLADSHLFTNASLAIAQNAALLAAVVGSGGPGSIQLVGEETGVVAPTPLASVSRGRLAPFLLQLGACLILFLLMQGRAFGRLADPLTASRRAFSEHVRALGTQYARARAARHALTAYATWVVDRLRERVRLSSDRGIGDLSTAIAARTNRPLGDVARVLFASRKDKEEDAMAPDSSRAAVEQSLAMMRQLGQLLNDTRVGSLDRPAVTSIKSRRTQP